MSDTTLRLLRAASAAAGGPEALAGRLGLSEAMMRKYITGAFPVPDTLLLRIVDLILDERDAPPPAVRDGALPPSLPRGGQ